MRVNAYECDVPHAWGLGEYSFFSMGSPVHGSSRLRLVILSLCNMKGTLVAYLLRVQVTQCFTQRVDNTQEWGKSFPQSVGKENEVRDYPCARIAGCPTQWGDPQLWSPDPIHG